MHGSFQLRDGHGTRRDLQTHSRRNPVLVLRDIRLTTDCDIGVLFQRKLEAPASESINFRYERKFYAVEP